MNKLDFELVDYDDESDSNQLTSFEQQLIQYHQMSIKRGKGILHFNNIKPGLNFLVPTDWWTDFYTNNWHVLDPNDIKTPHTHPLQVLYDLQLLTLPTIHTEHEIGLFKKRAKDIGLRLANSTLQLKEKIIGDGDSRLFDQVLGALENNKEQETEMKVVLCLGVEDGIKENEVLWSIVTPHIYKTISSNVSFQTNKHPLQHIIGIPIFLNQLTKLQDQNDKSYDIKSQIQVIQGEIVISNSEGADYAVLGFFPQDTTYEELMRYLFEGLNVLMDRREVNKTYFTKKNLFFVDNKYLFEDFMEQNSQERLNMYNLIKLENWFGKYTYQYPQQKFSIFQFACRQNKRQLKIERSERKFLIKYQPSSRKYIKKDTDQAESRSDSYRQLNQDTMQIGHTASYQEEKLSRPRKLHFQVIRNEAKNNPSSHSIDYWARLQSEVLIQCPGLQEQLPKQLECQLRSQEQINYTLWKDTNDLAQIITKTKMRPSITVPNSSSKPLQIILKDGRIAFLEGKGNKLITNSSGQMIEQQLNNEDQHNPAIIQGNLVRLEELALEMAPHLQLKVPAGRNELGQKQEQEQASVILLISKDNKMKGEDDQYN